MYIVENHIQCYTLPFNLGNNIVWIICLQKLELSKTLCSGGIRRIMGSSGNLPPDDIARLAGVAKAFLSCRHQKGHVTERESTLVADIINNTIAQPVKCKAPWAVASSDSCFLRLPSFFPAPILPLQQPLSF